VVLQGSLGTVYVRKIDRQLFLDILGKDGASPEVPHVGSAKASERTTVMYAVLQILHGCDASPLVNVDVWRLFSRPGSARGLTTLACNTPAAQADGLPL
jgi:hypothetical protein